MIRNRITAVIFLMASGAKADLLIGGCDINQGKELSKCIRTIQNSEVEKNIKAEYEKLDNGSRNPAYYQYYENAHMLISPDPSSPSNLQKKNVPKFTIYTTKGSLEVHDDHCNFSKTMGEKNREINIYNQLRNRIFHAAEKNNGVVPKFINDACICVKNKLIQEVLASYASLSSPGNKLRPSDGIDK
jgi:hypothetical protein